MKLVLNLLMVLVLFVACKQNEPAKATEQEHFEAPVKEVQSKDATSAEPVVYETSTGKSIQVVVENKSNSLNDLKIIPLDFLHTRDSFSLDDTDPLKEVIVADLDTNGYDEIYLITASTGSGSYSHIYGFASNKDLSITPIYVREIDENDLKPGGDYHGYMGHDSIYIAGQKVYRKFPVYKDGDENCCPSGGYKTLEYKLIPGEATWILKIEK